MNARKAKRLPALLLLGSMLISRFLYAGTVAVWKLDYEPTDTSLNARCLLDPANDLTAYGTVSKSTAVDTWQNLPPNPETSQTLLASPKNLNALGFSPSSSYLASSTFGAKVNITNSFTVEGWWNLSANPVGTSWFYLVGAHMSGAGRWILSLRNGGTNWILYVDSQIGDKAFPVKNDLAATNVWRHIALTYDRNAGSAQQGVWELFVDSHSHGAITNSSRPTTLSTAESIFSLGGRSGNSGPEKLDYWRVSDTALTSNAFLNAGTVVPEAETLPRTFAYWRMDSDAGGKLVTDDYIGNARLSGNLDTTNYTSTLQAAALQAFDGQPPNSAIVLADGNGGSTYSQASGACLQTPNLGMHLEIINSFTVEGWISPHRSDYTSDLQYIANTRMSTKGWAFALKKQTDSSFRFVIFAEDDAGVLCSDVPLSGDLTDWADAWKHVALVYDATAGNLAQGTWTCYLDGVQLGCVTNGRAVSGTSSSSFFHLSGRIGSGGNFCGYLDCWRACKAALMPGQLLNATTGASSATDVLALWPLNSSDGVYLDARDLVGGYNFNTPVASTYKTTAYTPQAVTAIPNPDDAAGFKGDPTVNSGSLLFNTPSDTAPRSYLSTTDVNLRNMLCFTNSFTVEGWFYRTKNPGTWQLLFATGTSPSFSSGGVPLNFTYRSNGYVLYVNAGSIVVNDVAFGGTTDDKTLNVWRHIALVYDVAVGKGTWTLYVDGVLQGTIENSATPVRSLASCVYVGGRPWSSNSFCGAIDSLRVTKGVLATNQFLNATHTSPTSPVPHTVAYWKLDSDGTTLDASSQVEPRYAFITDAYAPTGATDQCRRFVPMPDTSTNFIGDARANEGSASCFTSYLHVQNLGNRVDLDRAFTVEGWMKWNGATNAAVQTLVGTRFDTDYGWRLSLEKNGDAAVFRLFSQAPSLTPMLNACFTYDAAGLAGNWHHVALTFTPRLCDTGTWELFVDGQSVGTTANRFYPSVLTQSHWFLLGGCLGGTDSFDGLIDCWRVSDGALTAEQMMYRFPRGTMVLLR